MAVLFVKQHATAFPLTDEWEFVRSVANLQEIDWSEPGAIGRAIDAGTWNYNSHVVVLPFLLYWLLAPLTGFDNRLFISVTRVIFVVQVLLYRRWSGGW